MNTRVLLIRTVVTFTALAMAGIGVAVGARGVASPFEQTVLVAVGSAMFGGALAFLLVRVFTLLE